MLQASEESGRGRVRGGGAAGPGAIVWLVWVRWLAALGQLLTVGLAILLAPEAPWHPGLFGVIAFGAMSNIAFHYLAHRRRVGRGSLWLVLAGDVGLLTILLLLSGGASNPFSVFYLVYVVLAGWLLSTRGAWVMALLTTFCFGLLFLLPSYPAEAAHSHGHGDDALLHYQGMWLAFVLAGLFVALFVTGLTRALAARERELASLRSREERAARLATLGAFSASAAHELGSPLTTIAIASKDVERWLVKLPAGEGGEVLGRLQEDMALIRSEVERCRIMLHDLSRQSGVVSGEPPQWVEVAALWAQVEERSGHRPGLSLEKMPLGSPCWLYVPKVALVQSLVNLVENAHEAQQRQGVKAPILVGARVHESLGSPPMIELWVRDRGGGFEPEIMEHIGQAFVTSDPEFGLGLGLYLAQMLAQALSGRLIVENLGEGAEVILALPQPEPPDGRGEAGAR